MLLARWYGEGDTALSFLLGEGYRRQIPAVRLSLRLWLGLRRASLLVCSYFYFPVSSFSLFIVVSCAIFPIAAEIDSTF